MKISLSISLGLMSMQSLLFSVLAQTNETDTPGKGIAYFTYFSDEECQNFAGIKAALTNDPFQVLNAPMDTVGSEISCVDAMACLYQPEGRTCQSLNVAGEFTNVEIEIREEGVYECDESNVNIGLPECSLLDSSACYQSSAYNCHFRIATAEQLTEDPDRYIPAATDLDGLGQYGFLIYYNDEECTDLGGLRGHVSDNPYFLHRAGPDQDIMCQDEMACYLYEEGLTCEALDLSGEPAQALIEVDGEELFECDSSNENLDEVLCDIIDPSDCKTSSVYNCNFHYRSAVLFAKDPAESLKPQVGGGMVNQDMPTPPPGESPSMNPPKMTEAPTSAGTSTLQSKIFVCLAIVLGLTLTVN